MSSKHVGIEQARKTLGDLALEVRRTGEPITLTRGNSRTPVARIAPLEDTVSAPATEHEIASHNPGRGLPATYPLLERVTERYDLGREEAHDAIHAYLSQLVSLDGEDAVVLSRRPIEERRAEYNPGDRNIHHWLTIDADAVAVIEEQFAGSDDSEIDDG